MGYRPVEDWTPAERAAQKVREAELALRNVGNSIERVGIGYAADFGLIKAKADREAALGRAKLALTVARRPPPKPEPVAAADDTAALRRLHAKFRDDPNVGPGWRAYGQSRGWQ